MPRLSPTSRTSTPAAVAETRERHVVGGQHGDTLAGPLAGAQGRRGDFGLGRHGFSLAR